MIVIHEYCVKGTIVQIIVIHEYWVKGTIVRISCVLIPNAHG